MEQKTESELSTKRSESPGNVKTGQTGQAVRNRDSHEIIIDTTGRNNCGGRCLIHVHMKDGKIERLTTETQAEAGNAVPLCACVRGMNYHKTFLDEGKRLKYPMKRVGERGEGKFERITWEEAVDIIAKEWIPNQDIFGAGFTVMSTMLPESAGFCGAIPWRSAY